jgi:hypothetical protein
MTAVSSTDSSAAERETPKFTGVTVHRDPRGRFAVRYPTDWHTFEIRSDEPVVAAAPEGTAPATVSTGSRGKRGTGGKRRKKGERPISAREGFGFAPDAGDPATAFTVWAAPLGENVVAEDLDDLQAGVDEGLQALEDCAVESAGNTVLGNLIRFERIYTFRERAGGEAGVVRKRKQWLLYVEKWLICLTWQGSTVEEYRYWFAMANQSFLTFELPTALWFYTDRDLLAQLGVNTAT